MKIQQVILVGILVICLLTIFSCKKELSADPVVPDPPEIYPSPFADLLWLADTYVVTEPATYESLNEPDKSIFGTIGNWWNGSNLLFKSNGDAQSDAGDWDFGYVSWRLINKGKDIEVSLTSSKDTLYAWKMDSTFFSYEQQVTATMRCTYIYRNK